MFLGSVSILIFGNWRPKATVRRSVRPTTIRGGFAETSPSLRRYRVSISSIFNPLEPVMQPPFLEQDLREAPEPAGPAERNRRLRLPVEIPPPVAGQTHTRRPD